MVPAQARGFGVNRKFYALVIGVFIPLLLASAVCAQSTVRADPNKFAVIVTGAGGEAAYEKQFDQWTTQLQSALSDRYNFGAAQTRVLPRATAADVKRTFAELKSQLNANNVLFVFLIGHGSFDGKESKFNLVGPDLAAAEYNVLLSSLPTRRVVIFNMASASGEFVKSLAAKGRIVVTATRSGQESNATRFPGFFIEALNAKDAD